MEAKMLRLMANIAERADREALLDELNKIVGNQDYCRGLSAKRLAERLENGRQMEVIQSTGRLAKYRDSEGEA